VITNCTIIGNSADFYSGGVRCDSGGTISGCTIRGNSANYGGGVVCWYGGSVSGSAISSNSATMYGGGIYCYKGGAFSGCKISSNYAATYGGGVYCWQGGVVSACNISGNSADIRGGGVYCYQGGGVSRCTISGNNAVLGGGGVSYWYSGLVSDCIISSNSAIIGGGAYFYSGGTMTNSLICGMNSATYGGGAFLEKNGKLYNCTIAGNNASDSGGGIVCSNGGYVVNSIIYTNTAMTGDVNWKRFASGGTFTYCCTTPTNNLPVGTYCTSENPMFESPGSDYHLQGASPCINVGTNMPWMIGAKDIEGNNRIIDGTVDMGAYEYAYPPFIDITNHPGIVPYDQTTAYISGTDLNIAGQLGLVNDRHPEATNFFAQGFSTNVFNLEHGDNQITVFGTNAYGYSTNDIVTIHRKTSIESRPQIATNALIFPSAGAQLYEGDLTNIIWDFEGITDDIDGTNLTISKISVHLASTTNEVGLVTNDISNLLGGIPWLVPEDLIGGETNYVLKFEVVDSSSLTNSRIFWDNKFTIVPEMGSIMIMSLVVISALRRVSWLRHH